MIKAIYHAVYKDELSTDEGRKYHLETHAPLGERISGMRKYTVSFPADPDAVEYDVIAESWYDDEEAMRTALETPEGQEAVADIGNFVDADAMTEQIVEVNTIFDESTDAPPRPPDRTTHPG
jgi:uncharacterized protein (TIGR02118 family)